MNVLQVGSDRTPFGNLNPAGTAVARQVAYGAIFGRLDLISFSLRSDPWIGYSPSGQVHIHPTRSSLRVLYGFDTLLMLRMIPRPHVVSAQDPFETGLLAWVISCMTGAALHVQIHTDVFSPAFRSSSVLNRFRVVLARFVLGRAARIRVVSDRIRLSLAPLHLAVPISVIPIFADIRPYSGSDIEALRERFASFSHRFLIVSRLEAEKGVGMALASFARAAPVSACLIVVGSGSVEADLKRQAGSLGVSSRVFFEGTQDPAAYYALADLVLVPSRYEGYGLVVVEALAAGKPVLATDVGIAREAGAIIASEASYADAIRAWVESGERAGHLRLRTHASFEEYVRDYCADISASVPQVR